MSGLVKLVQRAFSARRAHLPRSERDDGFVAVRKENREAIVSGEIENGDVALPTAPHREARFLARDETRLVQLTSQYEVCVPRSDRQCYAGAQVDPIERDRGPIGCLLERILLPAEDFFLQDVAVRQSTKKLGRERLVPNEALGLEVDAGDLLDGARASAPNGELTRFLGG